jgi:hypothetical protein
VEPADQSLSEVLPSDFGGGGFCYNLDEGEEELKQRDR